MKKSPSCALSPEQKALVNRNRENALQRREAKRSRGSGADDGSVPGSANLLFGKAASMNRKSPATILDLCSPEPTGKRRKFTPDPLAQRRNNSSSPSVGLFSPSSSAPAPSGAHGSGTKRTTRPRTVSPRRNAPLPRTPSSSYPVGMPSSLPQRRALAPSVSSPSLSSPFSPRKASLPSTSPRSIIKKTAPRAQSLQSFPPCATLLTTSASTLSTASASSIVSVVRNPKSFVQTELPFSQCSPPRSLSGSRLPHSTFHSKQKSLSQRSPAKSMPQVGLPHPGNQVKPKPCSQRLPAKTASRARLTHPNQGTSKALSQTRLAPATSTYSQSTPQPLRRPSLPTGTQRRPVDLVSPVKQSSTSGANEVSMANSSAVRSTPGEPPRGKPPLAARSTPGVPPTAKPPLFARSTPGVPPRAKPPLVARSMPGVPPRAKPALVNGESPVKKRRVEPPLQSRNTTPPARIHPFFKQKFSRPVSSSSSNSSKPVPSPKSSTSVSSSVPSTASTGMKSSLSSVSNFHPRGVATIAPTAGQMNAAKSATTSIGGSSTITTSSSSSKMSTSSSSKPPSGPSSSTGVKPPIANTSSLASCSNVSDNPQYSASHSTPVPTHDKPVSPSRGDSAACVKPRHGPVYAHPSNWYNERRRLESERQRLESERRHLESEQQRWAGIKTMSEEHEVGPATERVLLSQDLLTSVFKHVRLVDLVNVASVCKTWALCLDPEERDAFYWRFRLRRHLRSYVHSREPDMPLTPLLSYSVIFEHPKTPLFLKKSDDLKLFALSLLNINDTNDLLQTLAAAATTRVECLQRWSEVVEFLLCRMFDFGLHRYFAALKSALDRWQDYEVFVPRGDSASGLTLTDEQQRVVSFRLHRGDVVKVTAFAGTGKTTTAIEFVRAHPQLRMLYLTFNRKLADDAEARLEANMLCNCEARTIDSVVYRAYMGSYTRHWTPKERERGIARHGRPLFERSEWDEDFVARALGWKVLKTKIETKWGTLQVFYGKDFEFAGKRQFTGFPPANRQFFVCAIIALTLKYFMTKDGDEIQAWHCPRENSRLFEALAEVDRQRDRGRNEEQIAIAKKCKILRTREPYLYWAREVWRRATDKTNFDVTMNNPALAKLFDIDRKMLTGKTVGKPDVLIVDEAQDMDACQAAIIMRQPAAKMLIGDEHQEIYAWRGAFGFLKDARCRPTHTFSLSHSFRYGANVSSVLNALLSAYPGVAQRSVVWNQLDYETPEFKRQAAAGNAQSGEAKNDDTPSAFAGSDASSAAPTFAPASVVSVANTGVSIEARQETLVSGNPRKLDRVFRPATKADDVLGDLYQPRRGARVSASAATQASSSKWKRWSTPTNEMTVICRTNFAMFMEAFHAATDEKTIGFVRAGGNGSNPLESAVGVSLLHKIELLVLGQVTRQGVMICKQKWTSIKKLAAWAEATANSKVLSAIALVHKFKAMKKSIEEAVKTVKAQIRAKNPDVWLTTVHTAKGLEWDCVHLSDDFKSPFPPTSAVSNSVNEENLNLMYVAASRAKTKLVVSAALQEAVNAVSTADETAVMRVYTSGNAAHARWLHTAPERLVCDRCHKCLSDEATDEREESKQQAVAEGELVVAAEAESAPVRGEPTTSRFYVHSRPEVCPTGEAPRVYCVECLSHRHPFYAPTLQALQANESVRSQASRGANSDSAAESGGHDSGTVSSGGTKTSGVLSLVGLEEFCRSHRESLVVSLGLDVVLRAILI